MCESTIRDIYRNWLHSFVRRVRLFSKLMDIWRANGSCLVISAGDQGNEKHSE